MLTQICQRSESSQDATCQNRYINSLADVKLFKVVDEMVGQILIDGDKVDGSYCNRESDMSSYILEVLFPLPVEMGLWVVVSSASTLILAAGSPPISSKSECPS